MRQIISSNLVILFFILMSTVCKAQEKTDTARYSVSQAEKVFLENNLPLLAERLNISQADARILQAKVWPNPTLSLIDVQVYNTPNTDPSPPFFGNFFRNRNLGAQLDQLVYTARKRKKNIDLATQNKVLAQSTFIDILQGLKAEFRQTAAELLYLQQIQSDQAYQLSVVKEMVRAQKAQLREGNISQTEMFRIKALQISVQADINSTQENITEKQQSLKNLMAIDPKSNLWLTSDTPVDAIVTRVRQRQLTALMDLASRQNAGIQVASNEKLSNAAALVVEKANRVPDVTLGLHYDRATANQLDYVGANISMELPFFARNKGNIRAAQLEVQKSDLMYRKKVAEVNNAVVKVYTDLDKAINLYEEIDKDYLQQLDGMIGAVSRNFMHRNISMLEFLDLFESFRQSKEKYYEAVKTILLKKEDLNYLTGEEL